MDYDRENDNEDLILAQMTDDDLAQQAEEQRQEVKKELKDSIDYMEKKEMNETKQKIMTELMQGPDAIKNIARLMQDRKSKILMMNADVKRLRQAVLEMVNEKAKMEAFAKELSNAEKRELAVEKILQDKDEYSTYWKCKEDIEILETLQADDTIQLDYLSKKFSAAKAMARLMDGE